jgi:hypothetical protein
MSPQDLFDWIRDNVSIRVEDCPGVDYGREYREVFFKLIATDPSTGEEKVISEDRISL